MEWNLVSSFGMKSICLSVCIHCWMRPVNGIHIFSTLFFLIFFFFFIYWRVSCGRNCVGGLFDASSNRIFYPPFVEERKNPSTMSWGRSIYWLFFSSLSVTFFCFIPSGFVSGYAIEIGRKAIILLAVLSVGGPSSSERRGKCGRAGTMEGNYPLDDVDILQRPGDEWHLWNTQSLVAKELIASLIDFTSYSKPFPFHSSSSFFLVCQSYILFFHSLVSFKFFLDPFHSFSSSSFLPFIFPPANPPLSSSFFI